MKFKLKFEEDEREFDIQSGIACAKPLREERAYLLVPGIKRRQVWLKQRKSSRR